jgi:hypothetical protein
MYVDWTVFVIAGQQLLVNAHFGSTQYVCQRIRYKLERGNYHTSINTKVMIVT